MIAAGNHANRTACTLKHGEFPVCGFSPPDAQAALPNALLHAAVV